MKAKVQYNDFKGTVAADISDFLNSPPGSDDLSSIAKYFELDESRFTMVGLSISGTKNQYISLICIDKERSTKEKEFLVSMSLPIRDNEILDILFKRINIVLHNRFDDKYIHLDFDEEVTFSDFHKEN